MDGPLALRVPTPHAPLNSDLSYASVVPRHLVHRSALAEVLLTDWRADGGGHYRIAAQWSRSHSLYRIRTGRHDPLMLAETLRQAGILLSQIALDVPADHQLVMDRMRWSTRPAGIPAGTAPALVVGYVRVAEPRRRTRSVVSLRIDIDFVVDDYDQVGSAAGWARCLSPSVYERVRGRTAKSEDVVVDAPEPVDAALVGAGGDDVVLAPAAADGTWHLRPLTDHPVLFDHPLDHLPGMLMIEGARQAGRLVCGWPDAHLARCDTTFSRFVELTTPSTVKAILLGADEASATLDLRIVQHDVEAATGTIEMRRAYPLMGR